MTYLTNVLYWVSTSLMIPVVVALLIAFVKTLLIIGEGYGMYMKRIKLRTKARKALETVKDEGITEENVKTFTEGDFAFSGPLKLIAATQWHNVHSEKIISDFELSAEKDLETSKTLMRLGPMLGLMGTLIPMGPALVGLASGDIASMAVNMQVAFSTTVIGIFIGAFGYLMQLVKQRWYRSDLNDLAYIYELAKGQGWA